MNGCARPENQILHCTAMRAPRYLTRAVIPVVLIVMSGSGLKAQSPEGGEPAATSGQSLLHQTPANGSMAPVGSEPEAGASPSSDASPGRQQNPASGRAGAGIADPTCHVIGTAAAAHDLPLDFFIRLIWQESRFNPNSVSRAGAQGIAQFMPGTARWRGLANPFERDQALHESARWLRELREQFGNLGLAAAAYNSGPRRVQDWLAGRGHLPGETRAYVRIITGRAAEEWIRPAGEDQVYAGKSVPCEQIARLFPRSQNPRRVEDNTDTNWKPWGLQLTGSWSERTALSDYRELQKRYQSILGDRSPMVLKGRMAGRGPAPWYRVRVAESSRQRADELCSRLESAGGKCLVFRN